MAEAGEIIVQGKKWQINRDSKLNSDQRRQIAVRKGFIGGEDSVYVGNEIETFSLIVQN